MLVLARKVGESIMIGENITVTITRIRGESVRIGIDAPRDVTIHRPERGACRKPRGAKQCKTDDQDDSTSDYSPRES